mgnify:CR=1 FL=1
MEHRKLIKFGNSSHVISLPNTWLKRNNVEKGDTLYIEENGNNELILSSEKKQKVQEEKQIVIGVESKTANELSREVISAYINNNKTIKLVGKDIEKKSKDIREIIKGLSGVEVLEQTKDHIIAKDFLNIEEISLMHLVKRMDILTKNMLADAMDSFHRDAYQSLMQRDEDINRLLFLAHRVAKFFLEHPDLAPQTQFSLIECTILWQIADHLERFADETKRSSRFLRKLEKNAPERKEIEMVFKEIDECYVVIMRSLYGKNQTKALSAAVTTKKLIEKCDKISEKSKEKNVIILMERVKTMIDHLRTIAHFIYN